MATYFSMSITVSGLERNCGLDQHIEHFAFDIDGAPNIDDAAIQVTPRSAVARRGIAEWLVGRLADFIGLACAIMPGILLSYFKPDMPEDKA
jgi:hypothetical protein